MPGLKRSREELLDYIGRAKKIGIPISVDIAVYRDVSFDPEQQEALSFVGRNLK